ncbi:hypothetical protein V6N13_009744 [Hibiscus sabdariffa]|uniref:Uncharacterized protein n=1 Tax=Hibiscus sabdariffa TaxID=183260 RepID=A0ABR2BA96_9ROSI
MGRIDMRAMRKVGRAGARLSMPMLTWKMVFIFFLSLQIVFWFSGFTRVFISSPKFGDDGQVRGVSPPSNSVSMQAFKSFTESPDFLTFVDSIAADPNAFNDVSNNPALTDFIKSQKKSTEFEVQGCLQSSDSPLPFAIAKPVAVEIAEVSSRAKPLAVEMLPKAADGDADMNTHAKSIVVEMVSKAADGVVEMITYAKPIVVEMVVKTADGVVDMITTAKPIVVEMTTKAMKGVSEMVFYTKPVVVEMSTKVVNGVTEMITYIKPIVVEITSKVFYVLFS